MRALSARAFRPLETDTGKALVFFYLPPGGFATDPDQMATPFRNVFTNESDSVQGTVKADLGFANLTSYTQYPEDDALNLQDLDASAGSFFDIRLGIKDKTVSQEFVLNSKSGPRLQWTAGVNYFQYRDTYLVDASFGAAPFLPFGGSSTDTQSYAGFLDMTYELTSEFFLTVGARYSHDEVTDAYFKTNFAQVSYQGPDGNPVSVIGVPPQTKIPVKDACH